MTTTAQRQPASPNPLSRWREQAHSRTKPSTDRDWVRQAVQLLEADARRSADTHLRRLAHDLGDGVDIYLKDESGHPTGSLKHRLARSLILYGICNGWIGPDTTLVEASSGSTAVSEAYFARLLGLPFLAVIPRCTTPEKVALIQQEGGRCELVDDGRLVAQRAHELAKKIGGHFLDQFTYAERATDWRGNNNIAERIFAQMSHERFPEPTWVVVGAGTGGTSATIGRYVRYRGHPTRLAVVDPENSAFFPAWTGREPSATTAGSRIEGIGRPRVEPSFAPHIVDRMIQVPDLASIETMRWLKDRGVDAGPSTGCSMFGSLLIAEEMAARGERGSLVTILCDRGDRYRTTYHDQDWVAHTFAPSDGG
jgi:cysteine synthase A